MAENPAFSLSLNLSQNPTLLDRKPSPFFLNWRKTQLSLSLFLSKSVAICSFGSWVLFIDLGFEFWLWFLWKHKKIYVEFCVWGQKIWVWVLSLCNCWMSLSFVSTLLVKKNWVEFWVWVLKFFYVIVGYDFADLGFHLIQIWL